MTASKFEIFHQWKNPVLRTTFELILAFIFSTSFVISAPGQSELSRQDSFNKHRFWTVAGAGTIIYTATVIGLNEAWYKDTDRTSFHFFNDWKEWNQMDKMGHAFTAYFETELSYRGALWTGISQKRAVWTAASLGMLYQSTLEVLDAFSAKWGFSIPDMAFNIVGVSLFAAQELWWNEQRIRFKISSTSRNYAQAPINAINSNATSSLSQRANNLYGQSLMERYLKDYNAQTIWISFNPKSLFKSKDLPRWLNLAVGYGSENLFGGFGNTWVERSDLFQLDVKSMPRFRQWYISPDVDFTKIKTKSKFLRTAFRILNIFKIPAPAVELSSRGKVLWHWLHL